MTRWFHKTWRAPAGQESSDRRTFYPIDIDLTCTEAHGMILWPLLDRQQSCAG